MKRGSILLLFLSISAFLLAACDFPGGDTSNAQSQRPQMHLEVLTPVPISTTLALALPTQTAAAPLPTTPPTLAPPPPTLALDTKEVEKQLLQVEADTAKMRGLKPKTHVPEHFISSAEMSYMTLQDTLKDYTPEMAHLDAMKLWLLLMIDDRTIDFRQMEVDFAGSSILGLYKPDKKELFVRADNGTLSPASQETLAHEYVHSLQDQYHDLSRLMPPGMDHDRQMAVSALVEGDATVSGILYASRYMTMGDFNRIYDDSNSGAPPVPGRAPIYLQQGWQFPYTFGSRFVLNLAGPGNYKPIYKAFTDPPRSTEQIIHPEKYLSTPRDEPLPVALPPMEETLGAGWKALQTDTLGEFDLYVMLVENYQESPEAAVGWGGALYTIYSDGTDYVTVMGSRWDTKKDADEWDDAFTQSFKLFNKKDGLWSDRGRVWGTKRSGEQIMFVSGTNTAAVQKVLTAIKP